MKKIDFETVILRCDDITKKNDLDKLVARDNVQLKTDYTQILHRNLANEFEGYFAVIKNKHEIIGWTHFFIDDHFVMKGILRSWIGKLYDLFPIRFKSAFISSPVSEYNDFHIHDSYQKYRDEITEILIKEIINYLEREKIHIYLIKDHIHECNAPIIKKKFTHFHFMPGTILDLETMCKYSSIDNKEKFVEVGFQNYLGSLKKKWRANIKNKINKRKDDLTINVIPAENLTEEENIICHKLYLQTINKQSIKHECLSEDYFSECAKTLQSQCQMLIARINDEIVGFAQLLENKDSVINVRMGMNYEYARTYQLYYHLLYENIKYTIGTRKKFLYTSQTCYRPKLEVGAQLIPLHSYIHFSNPIFRTLLNKIVVNSCQCYTELIQSDKPSDILNKYELSTY